MKFGGLWRACFLGGLVHFPEVDVDVIGRAVPTALEWLQLPLEVTGVLAASGLRQITPPIQIWGQLRVWGRALEKIIFIGPKGLDSVTSSNLGGGWELVVTGVGFADDNNTEIFTEVALCGKKCEVISANFTAVHCIVPNVTTQTAAEGSQSESFLPAARIISRGASRKDVITPTCFHGFGEATFEVGSPECAGVFDGDPEITVGVDG
eukprot:5065067-Amphidinium_carterae.1